MKYIYESTYSLLIKSWVILTFFFTINTLAAAAHAPHFPRKFQLMVTFSFQTIINHSHLTCILKLNLLRNCIYIYS